VIACRLLSAWEASAFLLITRTGYAGLGLRFAAASLLPATVFRWNVRAPLRCCWRWRSVSRYGATGGDCLNRRATPTARHYPRCAPWLLLHGERGAATSDVLAEDVLCVSARHVNAPSPSAFTACPGVPVAGVGRGLAAAWRRMGRACGIPAHLF